MKLKLNQIIRNICSEVIKADASFTIAQRSVYLDMVKQEISSLNLQNEFLGIEELTLKLFLKPCRESWFCRLKRIFKTKEKLSNFPVFKIVGPNYPDHIVCEIKIKKEEKKFQYEMTLDGKLQKDPIYVNYP